METSKHERKGEKKILKVLQESLKKKHMADKLE